MNPSAESPNFAGKVPHLMCEQGQIAQIVLLPGDPGRVELMRPLFDRYQLIASNREYTMATGYYKGVEISVCSTGIGAPSTEIAVVELAQLGAKVLIRIGGAGALRAEISCGDLLISTGAMRLGGSSRFYAPLEYPAVASFEIIQCLLDAGQKRKKRCWTGLTASIGSFFAGQGRPVLGVQYAEKDLCEYYKKFNILSMEMESETIFTLGSLLGLKTGCVCAVHANRETNEWLYDFSTAQLDMCSTALDACVLYQERYGRKEKTH